MLDQYKWTKEVDLTKDQLSGSDDGNLTKSRPSFVRLQSKVKKIHDEAKSKRSHQLLAKTPLILQCYFDPNYLTGKHHHSGSSQLYSSIRDYIYARMDFSTEHVIV